MEDFHPNRIIQYLTDDDRLRAYEECVLLELIWRVGRRLDENEPFHKLCAYYEEKRVNPRDCATEIINQMGWGDSQVDPSGHDHAEDND